VGALFDSVNLLCTWRVISTIRRFVHGSGERVSCILFIAYRKQRRFGCSRAEMLESISMRELRVLLRENCASPLGLWISILEIGNFYILSSYYVLLFVVFGRKI
jgi:hypothetical protein